MPLIHLDREGGATVGATLNPQAGRPASAVTDRADGVFRDRVSGGHRLPGFWPCPFCHNRDGPMTVTLHVCATCKAGEFTAEGDPVPGARLLAALLAGAAPDGVRIVSVDCLSACNSGAAVALSAPGRWSYVYGRLGPDDAADILAGAAAYAAAPDGIVPWRSRPVIFRKQSLARIPPIGDPT